MNIYDFTCDFIRIGHNEYKCSSCNITIAYNGADKPIMICPYKMNLNNPEQYGIKVSSVVTEDKKIDLPTEPPSLMQKVFNFTKAATNHAIAGSPKCTDEQIHERYNICKSCEFFKNNVCSKCGCSLLREKVYMNKLAWADQSCPVGKWGPIKKD
jgi:hypothetical protein